MRRDGTDILREVSHQFFEFEAFGGVDRWPGLDILPDPPVAHRSVRSPRGSPWQVQIVSRVRRRESFKTLPES